MSSEENKALMQRLLAASVADDQSALRDLLAPDFVAHLPDGPQNREGFLVHNNVFVKAFSDRSFTAEDEIAEGDKVVTRATWRGVHSGNFRGLPATGKRITISAFIVERVKDGKSVEHWALFDQLAMMRQLGIVPPPQPSK